MELKDYQEGVLERLAVYLKVLKEKKQDALDLAELKKRKNRPIKWASSDFNFCKRAWEELNEQRLLPFLSTKQGPIVAPYKSRYSGMGRPIPNICLKVPTGGGKTLLGAGAIENINTDFFEKNTGFILWIVPTDSIYKQTLKALSNRESLYRQILDRTSLGKLKILQKTDKFNPEDIENHLCIMLLMLQSAGNKTKETLKMFRDSGKFPYFFPEADDHSANEKLLNTCKNLDTHDLLASGVGNLSIKHSLGNVLKLIQPLIIIDEGHRAYTEKAKKTLEDFNPRFILELSATPNKKEHHSNVLTSVSGNELKKEEMIKLPINVFNVESKDWKKALAKGFEVQQKLSKDAKSLKAKEDRYIRPIMLIRVERTGKDQRESKYLHSEDVKEYLIKHFNADPEEVKIKSATKDELGDENLLSEYSRVKYIITKEALKEGWDCPFAYTLVILSKTKAPVAIEQMIGRVLRQPHTQRTGIESLDQCYVVCMDEDVSKAVDGVRKGLENEGMDGLAGDIKLLEDIKKPKKKIKIPRRQAFRGCKIFLPKVLYRSGNQLRLFSYEQDLLYDIDWSKLKLNEDISLDNKIPDISHTQIDLKEQMELISSYKGSKEEAYESSEMNFDFMVQRLSDIIPNPWDAKAIVDKALSSLSRKNKTEVIWTNRFHILDFLRNNLKDQISKETEKLFREKLKNNKILFKLVSAGDSDLNWEMAKTLDIDVGEDSKVLRKQNNKDLQLSLFEDVYEEECKFNELEKKVAWYLDENSAIKWWHRIIEKQDWHLQGWQKNKVYPDFLVCLKSSKNGNASFSILETKGEHLSGNIDTEYKKKLFALFKEYSDKSIDAGSIEITDQKMTFDLVFQNEWREKLNEVFQA